MARFIGLCNIVTVLSEAKEKKGGNGSEIQFFVSFGSTLLFLLISNVTIRRFNLTLFAPAIWEQANLAKMLVTLSCDKCFREIGRLRTHKEQVWEK